jgi:hypothetical protein
MVSPAESKRGLRIIAFRQPCAKTSAPTEIDAAERERVTSTMRAG